MIVILVDTSVWLNLFKGNTTEGTLYFKNKVSEIPIAVCPVIVQEVLQGVKTDEDFIKIVQFFKGLTWLQNDPYEISLESAILYRDLRKDGLTIRSSNDCLIACYAIKNTIPLLQDDRDFKFIATKSRLKLV